ncbi:MAG: GTP cyclohydrolase I, partial [Burkholderiaceae bacterium]|nr:GTP cyclohydrolase I [Burkholderiaceae bacterium]
MTAPDYTTPLSQDVLARLAEVIESRKAGDPDKSYVARLFHKGTDAILKEIGEDPEREGLLKSASRAAQALRDFTRGYTQDVSTVLNQAIFSEEYDDMVIVRDIEMYSLCEHHLVPFFGTVSVGYLPQGKILG